MEFAFAAHQERDWSALPLVGLWASFEARRRIGPQSRTASNYELAWNGLIDGLRTGLGREPVAADVTTELVTHYLKTTAASRNWGEQTVQTYGGNIRSVVSGMRKSRLLPPTALFDFELPAVTKRLPVAFDDATLAKIFDALDKDRSVTALRLRFVDQLMLDCGPRPEEIASLLFGNLHQETSLILINGKGARERLVPVSRQTWAYLDDYMRVRPAPVSLAEPVLLAARGARAAVSAGQLSKDMHELLVELGLLECRAIREECQDVRRLYTLRKTFAQRSADAGMHPVVLAAIMGHSPNSLPMVIKTYYRVSPERMQADHAAAAVADRFHAYRSSARAEVDAERKPTMFFDRWSGPARSTRDGNSPSSNPSSRIRTSGA